ncbi:MAG: hypothetical protein WC521_03665 [Bdellovibrionales bacterium]|jgi:hypothetical protein
MSLFICPSYRTAGTYLPALLAKDYSTYMTDVDDTLYHPLTGVHGRIKKNILVDSKTWSAWPSVSKELAKRLRTSGLTALKDHNWTLPLIVDHLRQQEPENLMPYLRRIYAVEYSAIPPQPAFVKAVDTLHDNGKRLVFYSYGFREHILNAQRQIGFSPDTFGENDIIDMLKSDRNPQLLSTYNIPKNNASELFSKSKAAGIARAAEVLGLNSTEGIALADDNLGYLANAFDMLKIFIAKRKEDIAASIDERIWDFAIWSDEKDMLGRSYSPIGVLLEKVAAHLPKQKLTHDLLL